MECAFDGFVSDESLLARRELWSAVLKNVRAGIMPPRPTRVRRTKKSGSWAIGSNEMPSASILTTPTPVA